MKHLLPKLKKAFPFLNERSATETDFFEYCARKNIEIVFDRDISTGVYVICEGVSKIFINNKLRGAMLLYVMFHELAHHLFHFPSQPRYGVAYFSADSKKKNHFEAETVAALLMLPTLELHIALQNPEYVRPELATLVGFRLDLYNKFHI